MPAMRIERTRRNFTDETNRYDAKRDRLIRCARELGEQGNAAKVSVTDITSKMGITRGLFYYYFGGKNELNESIVESYVDDLRTSAIEACANAETREDAIQAIVVCVYNWLFDENGKPLPMGHVLKEMNLVEYARLRASDELATLAIREGLLVKYGKGGDEALYDRARFVMTGILGEVRLRPDTSLENIADAACAALRYRKRRMAQDECE